MKEIKIVIGANFGDEGKGLMTDYFAHLASIQDKKCIVVCHNGGAQRGHSVNLPDGTAHVFHHFGSGTFTGAHTYLSEDFIVNPILFRNEYEELQKLGYTPICFMHPDCKVTTPFDMLANQLLEDIRCDQKHGSCGMGIFETINRYKILDTENSYQSLYDIQKYYKEQRFPELLINLDGTYANVFNNPELIEHYLDDYSFMYAHSQIKDVNWITDYDSIIFEGGQGLLLDQNNKEYFPNLTPSNTGLKNPASIILETYLDHRDCVVEECYVTRSYVTRHGAGKLENECNKEDIGDGIEDLTNVPNQYQGALRYGKLNIYELNDRIMKERAKNLLFSNMFSPKLSITITHLNETKGLIFGNQKYINLPLFDCIYMSNSRSGRDINVQFYGNKTRGVL